MEKIVDDKRAIKKIEIFSNDARDTMSYNSRDGAEIKAYHENGEMGHIVWFAFLQNGVIRDRINSKYVSVIEYKKEEDKNGKI